MKYSLGVWFSSRDLWSFPFYYFPLFLCIDHWGRFLISPCCSLELCIQMSYTFPFLLCLSRLFFSQLFVRPPQTAILPFCIINVYDRITIFLIVLDLFSIGLSLLLCFLPREVTLALVVKLIWWCWILLTFACLERFWFLHQIWRRVLLGRVFLVIGSSLSSF